MFLTTFDTKFVSALKSIVTKPAISQRKLSIMGKKFQNRNFRFKIRFGPTIFVYLSSSFRKNDDVPKKISTGKNFQNRYYRFKTRFEPFHIDSDQKNRKFFDYANNVAYFLDFLNFLLY